MRRTLMLVWIWMAAAARSAEEPWHVQTTADRAFVVGARNPEDVQKLLVWCTRSLEELQKQSGLRILFARGQTLSITVQPWVESVQLRGGAGAAQEIWVPEKQAAGRPLAEAFVRACLLRVLQTEPPQWVVSGLAHPLLSGESRSLFAASLEAEVWARLPSPEILVQLPGSDEAIRHQAAAWLLRWLFRRDGPVRRDPEAFWRGIAKEPIPSREQWVRWAGAGNLRELHMQWDLWRQGQLRTLMSEWRLEAVAEQKLEELLRFRPAELGLDGVLDRYAPLSLPDLRPHLDEPWTADVLRQWMFRVQPLRFRQEGAFSERVGKYLEAAGLLLEAGEQKGARRRRTLEIFGARWAEAESMRRGRDDPSAQREALGE